ncbi:ESX secretion-associated protein EspG [Actinosynnema pretiosum subsp. pretiosum]|uniref:ESX secretion-associated protein EspG n=2 Tax=Actinosynnema TaxID=40566 RepID=C6WPR1_ACTMD|nr:ESX secretion-associated protein EspG [Actinosynnema mirum]ACU40612.1 hypothetical protein Amir_6816 [Actinosynnema mirum DSM 43827]AXX34126.1 hypothetical protein APASM_6761 [Actinosynnema pretiosum subsp. pretiosum]QUF02148.1 ESX secretion-associated protein EspG [Actinosynnema pretiosum subsp. pretiosum]
MSVFSFSLSHAAADILWEDLDLGSRPYPFEIRHVGRTFDERAGIRNAVYRDLESRKLAFRGRVVGEVQEALTLLVRADYTVNAIAALDARVPERQLLARGGATRDVAALAVLDDRMLKVDLIRSSALLHALVSLVPQVRPGPGHSMTLPVPQGQEQRRPRREEDYDANTFTSAVSARSARGGQEQQLMAIFSRPKLSLGNFGFSVRGRYGRETKGPEVIWFDNDQGRYMMQTRENPDGQRWMTAAPADSGRIAMQLGQDLNFLLNS